MAWGNRPSDRKFHRLPALVAVVTAATSLLALSTTADAGTTGSLSAVSGSAFGEHVDVNITGLGPIMSGPLPTVTLPATGGNLSASQPSIAVPPAGPTGIFLRATGPLTAHTEGTLGAAGSATSNAAVAGVSSLGVLLSSSIASQCSSNAAGSTASTTLAPNSTLKVNKDQTVTLPTSPGVNLTFQGVDNSPDGSGDTFTAVFNEQTAASGGGTTGVTVNAAHITLHGPTATGDIIVAQSHCDATAGPAPCTRITGQVTGPVFVAPGQSICYVDATVTGGITVRPGGQLSITHSTVSGGVKSNGALAFTLCGSDLKDPGSGPTLSVTYTTGPVRIGGTSTSCLGNSIAGNVKVAYNSGGVVFQNNFVGGSATFTANSGGPIVIKNNFIGGVLGCTANSPAPTNGGQPNTASGKTGQCVAV